MQSGTQVMLRDDWQAIYGVKIGKYLLLRRLAFMSPGETMGRAGVVALTPGEECVQHVALHSRNIVGY
jgi:hypothetical protein